jgi:hypothetical protein
METLTPLYKIIIEAMIKNFFKEALGNIKNLNNLLANETP